MKLARNAPLEAAPGRRLTLVPPPDKPPSDDEFKSSVYSFVKQADVRKTAEEHRHQTLVNKISALDGVVKAGFEHVDQRFRGVEARVTKLETSPPRFSTPPAGSKQTAYKPSDTGSHFIPFELQVERVIDAREIRDEAKVFRSVKSKGAEIGWTIAKLAIVGLCGFALNEAKHAIWPSHTVTVESSTSVSK